MNRGENYQQGHQESTKRKTEDRVKHQKKSKGRAKFKDFFSLPGMVPATVVIENLEKRTVARLSI